MKTYIIGLFLKTNELPMDMPLLEFKVQANDKQHALEKMWEVVSLETTGLD
jgi:hypothetical protein